MQKIKMVIFSSDSNYNDIFNEYLRDSEYVNRINAIFYSDESQFLDYCKNHSGHLLLTEKDFDDKDVMNFDRVVKLEELNTVDLASSIYKYQPFDSIISNVMALFFEKNGSLKGSDMEREASLLAFSSASGGVGKTSLALCLGKFLAQHDRRVLYLSLEKMQTTTTYLQSKITSSSELFYYLKEDNNRLMKKIEELKSLDEDTGVEFFNLPTSPEEMEDIDAVRVEELIDTIKSAGNYHYIIVDLDSSFHERNSTILNISDTLFWVLNPSESDFYRTHISFKENLFNAHINKDKTLFLLNKKGHKLNDECLKYDFKLAAELPFNIDWLDFCDDEKIKSDLVVGESLYKLLKNDFFEVEEGKHE